MRTWTITGVAVMVAVVVAIGPADMSVERQRWGGVGLSLSQRKTYTARPSA